MVQITDVRHFPKEEGERGEGIFLLNPKGEIIYANKKATTFLTLRKGLSFLATIPKKDREKVYSFYEKLSRGESISYTSYVNGRDIEISIHPIVERKKLVMFVGIIKDITRLKEMELNAKKILEREKIFRENVSHYFFNPLVIAEGYIHLLLDEKIGVKERKKLEAIKTAIERIESVVKNTIRSGRIEE